MEKRSAELLDRLVKDYNSGMLEHERVLEAKSAPAYIYNLFVGDYQFSYKQFKEIYEYLKTAE